MSPFTLEDPANSKQHEEEKTKGEDVKGGKEFFDGVMGERNYKLPAVPKQWTHRFVHSVGVCTLFLCR
jgi:hypothetical protein